MSGSVANKWSAIMIPLFSRWVNPAVPAACTDGRETIPLMIILPIALPGIITGIALRSAFSLAEIPLSWLAACWRNWYAPGRDPSQMSPP